MYVKCFQSVGHCFIFCIYWLIFVKIFTDSFSVAWVIFSVSQIPLVIYFFPVHLGELSFCFLELQVLPHRTYLQKVSVSLLSFLSWFLSILFSPTFYFSWSCNVLPWSISISCLGFNFLFHPWTIFCCSLLSPYIDYYNSSLYFCAIVIVFRSLTLLLTSFNFTSHLSLTDFSVSSVIHLDFSSLVASALSFLILS